MSLLRAFKQRHPTLYILLPYMLLGLIAAGWLFKEFVQQGETLLFAAGWGFYGGVLVFFGSAAIIACILPFFDP